MSTQLSAAQPNTHGRLSYYVAGVGACGMGLAALSSIMSNGGFALTAFLLLAAGFWTSWRIRTGRVATYAVDAVSLVALLVVLASILIVPDFRNLLLPRQALETMDLTMAVVLAWLMVACSFRLTTDMAVLFLCVPSLSLIGLAATFEPSSEIMTFFAVFLALGCFILVRENSLRHQERRTGEDGVIRLSNASMKLQIGVTASIPLAALIVGFGLGTLLYPRLVQEITSQIPPYEIGQLSDQFVEAYVPVATGPVELSNQEVLLVRCKRALLWRGRTFNTYNGKGWSTDLAADEYLRIEPTERGGPAERSRRRRTFNIPDHPLTGPRRALESIEQTYVIASGMYRTIFAVAEPKMVVFSGFEPALGFGSRLEADVIYGVGVSYKVTSLMSNPTPRELSTAPREYPLRIQERYLSVPETCWQVEKLTRSVTARLSDPYRKAMAIQSYLQSSFAYDTNAPAAPEQQDAVAFFLFKSKRGYCDIFSTAMVIMARQAGIPARWVTGFNTGNYESSDGIYHVRAKDRHAWAELYFPRYGWIAFDATPAADEANPLAHLREIWTMFKSDRETIASGLLILALIGYLVKAELLDRLIARRRQRREREALAATEVARLYRRMCDAMARAGYPRRHSTTPWEYRSQLGAVLGETTPIPLAVDTITSDFVEFRYSPREATPDRIAAMTASVRMLARLLKDAGRSLART